MRFVLICLTVFWPLAAMAQDDRGYIQGLLEDALSGDGRTVTMQGFAGALSSRATIQSIQVSDPDGVWLEMRDVAMVWTRSALLSGRIDIDEISVGTLSLPRLPKPIDETPSPEAGSVFALPELPVSVQLADLTVDRLELGQALFGQAAIVRIKGQAQLAEGAATGALDITRLDGGGAFAFSGGYSNRTRQLDLDLSLREPAGGIVANLINLPGRPSVAMSLTGDAPIDDFAAQLQLATDGAQRMSGSVILRADGDGDAASRSFRLDVGGDIAPVVAPAYRDFLGSDVRLTVEADQAADGTLTLSDLDLAARALRIKGSARIGADGWPQKLDLAGRIVPPSGDTVLLPVPGEKIHVQGGELVGRFDASRGEEWRLRSEIRGLDRAGLTAQTLAFSSSGTLSRDTGRVTGTVELTAKGLDFGNKDLSRAIGGALGGDLNFDWKPNGPVTLSKLNLSGADYGITGKLGVSGMGAELDPVVTPDFVLTALDLTRFSGVAGMDLAGTAALRINGVGAPLSGAFDLDFGGTTRDLKTGIAQLDPLLEGSASLTLSVIRDADGLRADDLRIASQSAKIEGTARLATGAAAAQISAEIMDTRKVAPSLVGASLLTLDVSQRDDVWALRVNADVPGATLSYDGTVRGDGETQLAIDGQMDAKVSRLSAFSDLVGRDLSGQAQLSVIGAGDVIAQSFDGRITGTSQDVSLSVPSVDSVLRGTTRFDLDAKRAVNGDIDIRKFTMSGPASVDFSGSARGDGETALRVAGDLVANVADLARFSGLAQRKLFGSANIVAKGQGDVIAQSFDLSALVRTQDLAVSEPQFDPLLRGSSEISLVATRDLNGVTDVSQLQVSGAINAGFVGSITGSTLQDAQVNGRLSGDIPSLRRLSGLTGQNMSGSARFDAQAQGQVNGAFSIVADVIAKGLSIGNANVDPYLAGDTRVSVSAVRDGDGSLRIERAALAGSGLDGQVSGAIGAASSNLNFELRLADLGRIVPELKGPATVTGQVQRGSGPWQVQASGSGPSGIGITANGSVAADASRMNLSVAGSAPLDLANARIAPQVLSGLLRFDLAVNGPPALSSVTGQVSTSGARLSLPTAKLILNDISGDVALRQGRAQLSLGALLSTGGRVQLNGPVDLAAPYRADLVARLNGARLRDGALYETTASGQVLVRGPLTGGAVISGAIDLGAVELRIPQIGPSYQVLDGLRHVNPPADVQRTLQFAGLTGQQQSDAASVPEFPIDLTIRAPNQIFVRGRGLDAELGGALTLKGTSNNLLPVGRFELVRGRLDLLGRRLTLSEGTVSLRGSFDPVIRFVATSDVEDVEITLGIEGAASAPELIVSSTPDLPRDQILALFLFGRDFTKLSALQAVQLAAAIRTLSGQGALGLTDQLRTGLGIDDLDIGTDADGKAQARVGKYISDNIYTDVTVNSEGKSEINLNLNLTPNVTVRGRLGSDGDSGVGVFFEKDY